MSRSLWMASLPSSVTPTALSVGHQQTCWGCPQSIITNQAVTPIPTPEETHWSPLAHQAIGHNSECNIYFNFLFLTLPHFKLKNISFNFYLKPLKIDITLKCYECLPYCSHFMIFTATLTPLATFSKHKSSRCPSFGKIFIQEIICRFLPQLKKYLQIFFVFIISFSVSLWFSGCYEAV